MSEKLTAELCEEMARACERNRARMRSSGSDIEVPAVAEATEANALALRLAALALRYAEARRAFAVLWRQSDRADLAEEDERLRENHAVARDTLLAYAAEVMR